MPDGAEVCGCNGVSQGRHRQGHQGQGPVHAGRGQEAHQGGVRPAAPVPASSSRFSPRPSAAPTRRPLPTRSRCAAAPSIRTTRCANSFSTSTCYDQGNRLRRTRLDDAERLRQVPPGAQLLPDLDLAARSQGRSAVALHQRACPRQHPEGRHLLGRAAHVGRPDQPPRSCARIADAARNTTCRPSKSPAASASTCSASRRKTCPASGPTSTPPAWSPATPTASRSAP